jgi:beta-lactamase class A
MARVDLPRLAAYARGLDPTSTWSIWAGPVEGGPWLSADADAQHYAASTMKLPLVMAAYRLADAGKLDLDATTEVRNAFGSVLDGSPFGLDRDEDSDAQTWQRIGQQVALRWLACRAIVRSGNLATNLILDAVGVEPVQQLLSDLGCDRTTFTRGIEDGAARDAGMQNLVAAADLARLLQALWADANATDAAPAVLTPRSASEMIDVLAAQQIADALPRRLPPGTRVAHKSGWVDGVDHDAGIVFVPNAEPFVFAMCTSSRLDRASAADVVATAARAAWDDVGQAAQVQQVDREPL